MKVIVETKGEYGFIDPYTSQEIHHNRPTVVKATSFVTDRLASNELDLLLKNLPNEASDETFVEILAGFKDPALKMSAIANYATLYGLDEYGNPTETPEDKEARLQAETANAQRLADEAAEEERLKAQAEQLKLDAEAEETAKAKAEEEALRAKEEEAEAVRLKEAEEAKLEAEKKAADAAKTSGKKRS